MNNYVIAPSGVSLFEAGDGLFICSLACSDFKEQEKKSVIYSR